MRKVITEVDVEENVLALLGSLGYGVIRGDDEMFNSLMQRAFRGELVG